MSGCAYLLMAFLDAALKLLKNADYLLGHSTLMVNDDVRSVRDKLKDAQKDLKRVMHKITYGETDFSSQSEMKVIIDEFVPTYELNHDATRPTPHPHRDNEWNTIERCFFSNIGTQSGQPFAEILLDGESYGIPIGAKIPRTDWKLVGIDTDYLHFQNNTLKAFYHMARKERDE